MIEVRVLGGRNIQKRKEQPERFAKREDSTSKGIAIKEKDGTRSQWKDRTKKRIGRVLGVGHCS